MLDESRRTLRARSINCAPQLLDLELKMGDQRTFIGGSCASAGQFRANRRGFRPRRDQRRFQRFDIIRNGGRTSGHESDGITKPDV